MWCPDWISAGSPDSTRCPQAQDVMEIGTSETRIERTEKVVDCVQKCLRYSEITKRLVVSHYSYGNNDLEYLEEKILCSIGESY